MLRQSEFLFSISISIFFFLFVSFVALAGCIQTPQQTVTPTQPANAAAANPTASVASAPPQQPNQTAAAGAAADAAEKCVELCATAQAALCGGGHIGGCVAWIAGPCLSDSQPGVMPAGWVCDVAHSPREATDNEPANQCVEYRDGRAHRFVEVDVECKLIRTV